MNPHASIRRFTARTSRDALRQVREALGDDAVVLSTQPAGQGIEVMAMAPEGLAEMARHSHAAAAGGTATATATAASAPREPSQRRLADAPAAAAAAPSVDDDVTRLQMSTLSFQDYVRTRMLKRRQAALAGQAGSDAAPEATAEPAVARAVRVDVRIDDDAGPDAVPVRPQARQAREAYGTVHDANAFDDDAGPAAARHAEASPRARAALHELPLDDDSIRVPGGVGSDPFATADSRQNDLIAELRSMKGLIEERFGALAFMERLQRRPAEARLTQKLLDCGFSPLLVRKLTAGLGAEITDEAAWAARILERNLQTDEAGSAIEDQSGVFALIGATGVGKTTTTAKLAAAFATRHGASQLGLITLDAYRVGAHEQLRAYGRILGVPVHTAHDRASLEDLLELLSAKKMVFIDTAGMAQRDVRTRELLDMLSHPRIQRLLVVNAASQGETIDDVVVAYRATTCAGVVLSKIDEAVKLGPALDAAIRHKLRIVGVANGQRVPEDWHRLPSSALVERAMRGGGSSAYRLDAAEMNLVFAAPQAGEPAGHCA